MLFKSTLREIKTSLSRYLAIFAIVFLGVAFFVGLKNCKPAMVKTADEYFTRTNFYHYRLLTSYGLDDKSVKIAKSFDKVKDAEGSYTIDVMTEIDGNREVCMKAMTIPKAINKPTLVKGRMPNNDDECVIDNYTFSGEPYKIGSILEISQNNDSDTVNKFKSKKYKIVGTVNTPIYADYQRGSTDIGNGSIDSFFYVLPDEIDVDYFTELNITLKGDYSLASAKTDKLLKSAEPDMKKLAKILNEGRRESAINEAQDKLNKSRIKYEDGLTKFNRERTSAYNKLNIAGENIRKGKKQLNDEEKKLNDTISGLSKNKSDIEYAIEAVQKGLEDGVSELDKELAAGVITDEDYLAKKAEMEAQADIKKEELRINLHQVEQGLQSANVGLLTIESKKSDIENAEKKLNLNRKKADSEFANAKSELDDALKKINDGQEKIDEMETGNYYAFSRNDNAGYSSFKDNSDILNNIAKIFPAFFFLIATLVCMTTMTKMIDEQRTQIGVLRALGYANSSILFKYMFYSGSAAFLGAVIGFFAGSKIFPDVIWNAYTIMYKFSDKVHFVLNPSLAILSILVALICSSGATWASMSSDFSSAPAMLIRPKVSKSGKRILLERIAPLWNRLSFLYKVSFRNVFRDKKRLIMMIIGVSGCTALLVTGFGINRTISNVADYQYSEIDLYDYQIFFNEEMSEKKQSDFTSFLKEKSPDVYNEILFIHNSSLDIKKNSKRKEVTGVIADGKNFESFVGLHNGKEKIDFPADGEAVVVKKIEKELDIKVGDYIEVRDGYRQAKLKVSGICDNYVGENVYISRDTYEKQFGKKANIKSAMIDAKDNADGEKIRELSADIAKHEDVAAVIVNMDLIDRVNKMMESLNMVIIVVIISAGLLAFVVIYNLTNIMISERIREIATFKVLGFNPKEISVYIFRENAFLTSIATIIGIPLGNLLLKSVIANISVSMIFFEPRILIIDYVMSVALTFAFGMVVNLAMRRKLKNVSMTESLKSVE